MAEMLKDEKPEYLHHMESQALNPIWPLILTSGTICLTP